MLGSIKFYVIQKDSSRRLTAFFLMLSLIMSCIAMVYSAHAFRDRIDEFRASDSDNSGWLISQLDVDHKALALAIARRLLMDAFPQAAGDNPGLELVNLRFDIFYGRVETVLASLQRQPISEQLQDRLLRLNATRDALAFEIETLDADDTDALQGLATNVDNAGSLVRDITTMALQFHVAQSDLAHKLERRLLTRFWIQSLVLLALIVVSGALAMRLWRELEARTLMMQRALATVSKAFDTSLSAVVIADMHGRILMANPAASHIFGVPAAQMEGRLVEEVMVPHDQRMAHRSMLELHRTTGHRKMIGAGAVRLKAMRMDGSPFDAEVSIAEDQDLDGRPILIGFIRDISEIIAAEEKLRDARDEAQRHASAKTMFLATMSHEMRTPLHGMIAALDLIVDHSMDAETRNLLQTARDCGDRALEQVNDVLQLTHLGESNLGAVAFSPIAVAQDIIRELTPLATASDTRLELVIVGDDSGRKCLGLANAFSGALYNLAGNAVKFTKNGLVTITLTSRATTPLLTYLKVEVADTGIGIATEDQARIFAEFETSSSLAKGRESGTGLGLPIAGLAVRRMGGTLSLYSVLGEGSRFSFDITLPYADAASDAARAAQPASQDITIAPPTKALDILVVDDNSINVSLMSKMITRLGHRPTEARNGLEAVATASMHAFDLILMDISMPVMDGREATLQIRLGGPSASAAIIGVTAYSETERLADLQASGMDAVLTKPVDTAQLSASISHVMDAAVKRQIALPTTSNAEPCQAYEALHYLSDMLGPAGARKFLQKALKDTEACMSRAFKTNTTMDQAADMFHSVVGATAVVGLSHLSMQLKQAEESARAADHASLARHQQRIMTCLELEKKASKRFSVR